MHIDASQLCFTEEDTSLKIAPDHFVKEKFWSDYIIMICLPLCFLLIFMMKYKFAKLQGRDPFYEAFRRPPPDQSTLAKAEAKTTWAAETYDQIKDWINLFLFKHRLVPFLILIFSLTAPFAVHDAAMNTRGSLLIHNILTFYGIRVSDNDYLGRFYAMLFIAVLEQIPQICVVVWEFFGFGFTVNFV